MWTRDWKRAQELAWLVATEYARLLMDTAEPIAGVAEWLQVGARLAVDQWGGWAHLRSASGRSSSGLVGTAAVGCLHARVSACGGPTAAPPWPGPSLARRSS